MTQRDWQKDMEVVRQLQQWGLDPGGNEDPAAFYTIDSDNIHTTVRADNMLGTDAELLNNSFIALEYWLQEAKTLQEIASGRGREALRLSKLLGDLNNELTASEERADATEAREQQLKEAAQLAVNDLELWSDKILAAKVVLGQLQRALSTLYPDTPAQPAAPKEGSHETSEIKRCD